MNKIIRVKYILSGIFLACLFVGAVNAGGKPPPCCDIPPIDIPPIDVPPINIPVPPINPIDPPKIPVPDCLNAEIPNPAYDACITAVKCATDSVNGSVCSTNTPPLCAKYRNQDNGGQSFYSMLKAGNVCGAVASKTDGATVALLNDLILNCVAGSDTPPPKATSQFCRSLQQIPEEQCASIPKTIGACIPLRF